MTDLFSSLPSNHYEPLAARMRPRTLDEYIGQQHLLGEGKPVRLVLEQGNLHSMLLWGPPGVGKTTLAKLMSAHVDAHFLTLSAVMSGVKDIRAAVLEAQQVKAQSGRLCVLFVDEVHRFNKSQQDAFLPFIEDGTFIFVGATTENPSFELNNALLSRSRVYLLKNLEPLDLMSVLKCALSDQTRGLGQLNIKVDQTQLERIAIAADGDARTALNLLEIASDLAVENDGEKHLTADAITDVLASGVRKYDKQGDLFYDLISAFHKSVRGSSPDGALY
ncbi:MAG: AAA family ATPase, partial [Pontibacterium sp.]